MMTNSYAISRIERAWLFFSVTLLVSAAFYGFLAARVDRAMSRPELTFFIQDIPVLLLISLSAGFFLSAVGHYILRAAMNEKTQGEVRHG